MMNMILDQCLEDIHAHRATVADCLAQHPDCALELGPLIDLALAIASLPEVRPSLAFRESTRARLLHLPIPLYSWSPEFPDLPPNDLENEVLSLQ